MLYPLTFTSILSAKPWGGRRLAAYGKPLPQDVLVGESWELADLDRDAVHSVEESQTKVKSGQLAGATLSELIASFGSDLMGDVEGDRFPLLVKFLNAEQNLSVQVHPTADYVATHPDTHLKTESWYIVDAHPTATMYLGFRPDVTRSQIEKAIGTAALVALLNEVPAAPGTVHHLPAGTVHSLGAGILVAEIQTPSDTTFRMYDWADEYGHKPRSLHLEEALSTMTLGPVAPTAPYVIGPNSRRLIETPGYTITEHVGSEGSDGFALRDCMRVLIAADGDASLWYADDHYSLHRGDTMIIPAAIASQTRIVPDADARLLDVTVPANPGG